MALAIVLAALLGQAPADADVVILKDGRKLTGVIVEENDQTVMLRIQVKGVKGAGGAVAIKKDEIAEIRRMPAAERDRQVKTKREPPRRIPAQPADVLGRPGFVAAGDCFEVRTNASEELAGAVAEALQQAYDGYLRHFTPRGGPRLPVLVFPGRAEYDAHLGRKVADLALYDPTKNVVLACSGVPKEEDARLRAAVAERRKEIERWRKKITDAEELGKGAVKEIKEKAAVESAAEKAKLRSEGRATPEALRDIDRQWEMTINLAIQLARSVETQGRDEGTKAIEECEKAILRDESLLAGRNRAMYEALFHECFHAFAKNRLPGIPRWLEEGMAFRFETCVIEEGALTHGAPNRPLLKLLGDGPIPALAPLLRGDGLPAGHDGAIDRTNRASALAWAVADYACPRLTAGEMTAYLSAAKDDPGHALAKALRMPVAKIDEAVRAHISSLR